jgi:hypothetical protein
LQFRAIDQKMLNIALPIAERSHRFAEAGYPPTPLLLVHGTHLIEAVVRAVRPRVAHHFIFIALREHLDGFGLRQTLRRTAPGCTIVPVERASEGAVRSVLMARRYVNTAVPLLVADAGQWIDAGTQPLIDSMNHDRSDGVVMTVSGCLFARPTVSLSPEGVVTAVTETASGDVVAGIYAFRHGRDFVSAADRTIAKARRPKTEFHLSSVCQELVSGGARLTALPVGDFDAVVHELREPADLDRFLTDPASLRAVA